MHVYKEFIYNWLFEISGRELFSKSITALIVGLTLVVISLISFYVSRKIIVSFFRRLSLKTTSIWDDILIKHKFFHGIAHLIPASIFYFEAGYANDLLPTAHMADHSLRAAEYALKAVKLAEKSIENERKWQDKNLSPDIVDLIISARDKQKIKVNVKDNK